MPGADAVLVPVAKVTDYLLSRTHPRGSMKAVWFEALGFAMERPNELVRALSDHARHDVAKSERTRYGMKYCVTGDIVGPGGSRSRLRSVWIVLDGEETPKLVTAYPDR